MTHRLLLAACTLLAAGPLLTGCADEPAPPPPAGSDTEPATDAMPRPVEVRGLYLGPAYDSAAAVVSHEAIPGLMNAMRMQLRVADRAELRGLREGDKIRFTLSDPDGNGYRMSAIETLPPDAPLDLADFGPDAVPPEASVDGETVDGGQ